MPLSNQEERCFYDLAQERTAQVSIKYGVQYDRFDHTIASYLTTIKSHIREAVEAQRDAMIDTYVKFNKFPNWQDYESFVTTLALFPDAGKQRFLDYCNRLSGPNLPKDTVDELAAALINELNQIIGISLLPLKRFIHEGAATAKLGKKINWNIVLTILGIVITVVGIVVGALISIGIPEIRNYLGLP